MTPLEATLNPRAYQALQVLKPILAAVGLTEPDMRQIYIGSRSIHEHSAYDGLSRAILDYDIPELTGGVVVDHYTTGAGFHGIISSQALHLAPITLRLGQGELDTFAAEHGLDGYVDARGVAKPALLQAAADLFYASFTLSQKSAHLWQSFGSGGNGYRLRFEITTGGAGQLRAIRYHSGITLLRQINDALFLAGLPRFVLKQISRVGAFYLPLTLKPEDETRLLAKRFPGGGAPIISVGHSERWPIPIGSPNLTAGLRLLEIGVLNLNAANVQAGLPSWCATVRVVSD